MVDDSRSTVEIQVYGFTAPVPQVFVDDANSSQQNPIVMYEALAVFVGVETFGPLFTGRRVSIHADNTWAISITMDGYARDSLLSSTVWKLHSANMRNRVLAWYSYVNTKLNISDGMSRPEWVDGVLQMFPQLQILSPEFPFGMW